jgi:hypothetical protein
MVSGDSVPRHLRHLVRDLDAMGDGTARSLVRALAKSQIWEPHFQIVRWRERRGDYQLDHDETYVLAMVNALGGGMDAETLNSALREDEELREETLWRIFEVPGTRRVNLGYLERYRGEAGEGWESSILTLIDDGTLSRQRVADACSDALAREFSSIEAAWFRRLASKVN